MPLAIITGASRGLGLALARSLAGDGWALAIDARGAAELDRVASELGGLTEVEAVAGDVSDPAHRSALVAAAGERVDLLVNNASVLGPSPQPSLERYPLEELERVYRVNVFAPVALAQLVLPRLPDGGTIINITSDAAVEAYEGWGGYGAGKAALDHLSAVLAVEFPAVTVWSVDPGDLRTDMHQAAFPGEDISDRPEPATVVPALLDLIGSERPSGRYRASELTAAGAVS